MYVGQVLHGFRIRSTSYLNFFDGETASCLGVLHPIPPIIVLSFGDVKRFRLISQGLGMYDINDETFYSPGYVVDRVSNFPQYFYSQIAFTGSTAFSLGLIIAGVSYGGLHLLAWQAPFYSSLQETLWQISSSTLVGSAFYITGLAWMYKRVGYQVRLHQGNHGLLPLLEALMLYGRPCVLKLIVPLSLFILPLYFFSRVYLVVDSFLQLAHLPDAVYQVTNWSQYFPHII